MTNTFTIPMSSSSVLEMRIAESMVYNIIIEGNEPCSKDLPPEVIANKVIEFTDEFIDGNEEIVGKAYGCFYNDKDNEYSIFRNVCMIVLIKIFPGGYDNVPTAIRDLIFEMTDINVS